jgi:hypothetical protein
VSELRSRLAEALLALWFSLAPSSVPPWRGDPDLRPVAVLAVGEPMTYLDPSRVRR